MRLLSMSFYITKDISYNSKNSTSSHASIHSFCPSIYFIDVIHLSTSFTYSSHPIYLSVDLSIYPNHIPYLSLLIVSDKWSVYYMLLSEYCNPCSILMIVKWSFILNINILWCGGLFMNVSFHLNLIIVSTWCVAYVC